MISRPHSQDPTPLQHCPTPHRTVRGVCAPLYCLPCTYHTCGGDDCNSGGGHYRLMISRPQSQDLTPLQQCPTPLQQFPWSAQGCPHRTVRGVCAPLYCLLCTYHTCGGDDCNSGGGRYRLMISRPQSQDPTPLQQCPTPLQQFPWSAQGCPHRTVRGVC